MARHGPTLLDGGYVSSPRQFGKTALMEQMRFNFPRKPKPSKPRPQRDPKKLHLHYDWIQKIVTFKLSDNIHRDDPTVWMTKRQEEAFNDFQKMVRRKAVSGEWGDYATIEVDPELYGIIEDILDISFSDGAATTCYNCGRDMGTLEELDAHEAECVG